MNDSLFTRCPVEGCNNKRRPRQYLCGKHWFRLPDITRDNLWLKDRYAAARLNLLFKLIREGWPLEEIMIVNGEPSGGPERIRGQKNE